MKRKLSRKYKADDVEFSRSRDAQEVIMCVADLVARGAADARATVIRVPSNGLQCVSRLTRMAFCPVNTCKSLDLILQVQPERCFFLSIIIPVSSAAGAMVHKTRI